MDLANRSEARLLVLHQAAGRVGAMDLGFTTEGGLDAALDGAEVIFNLGVDEIDIAGRALRDLPGQPRRPGRAPRRRDPAGCGLGRGIGHLREYRRTAADGEPGGLPAGRGAGELGDPARALRDPRNAAALRFTSGAARGDGGGGAASGRDRHRAGKRMDAAGCRRYEHGRLPIRGPAALSRQPDPAGQRSDGGADRLASDRTAGQWRRSKGHGRFSSIPGSGLFLLILGAVSSGDRLRLGGARLPDVRRPQGLGRGADASRAERGRALRAVAELRGLPEIHRQGSGGAGDRRQGGVLPRPDDHLRAGADHLGGDPLGGWLGDLGHECRDPVHLRHRLAARLRRDHGRLGVELEISVPRERCARRRR